MSNIRKCKSCGSDPVVLMSVDGNFITICRKCDERTDTYSSIEEAEDAWNESCAVPPTNKDWLVGLSEYSIASVVDDVLDDFLSDNSMAIVDTRGGQRYDIPYFYDSFIEWLEEEREERE